MFQRFQIKNIYFALSLVKDGDVNDSEEGTRHFMVNVIEPQFNLHSEEANVSSS